MRTEEHQIFGRMVGCQVEGLGILINLKRKKRQRHRKELTALGREAVQLAGREDQPSLGSRSPMTCGERRPAQSGCLKSDDLRGEKTRPARVLELPQPAGGPKSLRYLNQREESGRQSHFDQLGESGASATSTSGSPRETRRNYLRETRRSLHPRGT